MNFKTTLALVILLAVVGGYFYFVERNATTNYPGQQNNQATLDEGNPLFTADNVSTESIDRVTVTRGEDTLVFQKEGADWYQVDPVRFKLATWSMRSLIDDAAGTKKFNELDNGSLDDAFATVTLEDTASETKHVLNLGESTIGGRAKLKLDDDEQVLLTNDKLHKRIRRLKAAELRNKNLGAPGPAETLRFTVENEGQSLELQKADGRWFLDEERTERASKEAAEQIINSFGRVYIDTFVDDAPAQLSGYGLDSPRLVVTLATPPRTIPAAGDEQEKNEPGVRHVLRVGRAADLEGESFFATRSFGDDVSPVVFTINKSAVEPFEKEIDELRDPQLFGVKAADVLSLKITRNGKMTAIAREGDGSYRFAENDPGFEVDYNETAQLVDQIASLEADHFKNNATPEDEPAAIVTINDDLTARFYASNEGYFAIRSDEPVVYQLTAEDVKPLLEVDAFSLRDRTILDIKREDIVWVELSQGTEDFQFWPIDDEWTMGGNKDFEAEAFADLLVSLAPFRSAGWLREPVEEPTTLSIAIQTKDDQLYRVLVSDHAAQLEGLQSQFTISDALRRKLNAEYRDRTLLALSPEEITSVSINDVHLAREDDTYVSDAGEIDQEAAAGVFDTLAGLRVQRYTQPVPISSAKHRVTVERKDGEPILLELGSQRQGRTTFGDHRDGFMLDEATWEKLTAPLIKGNEE